MAINNFGIVKKLNNAVLYRGAQPDIAGFQTLKDLGVNVCYKLNSEKEYSSALEMALFGSQVICDPYPELIRYDLEHVKKTAFQIWNLLTINKNVFVHCSHGCDRTGLVVGAVQILYDNWSYDSILEERRLYGSGWFRDKIDFLDLQVLKKLSR